MNVGNPLLNDAGRAELRARAAAIATEPLDSPAQKALREAVAKAAGSVDGDNLHAIFAGLEGLFADPGQAAEAHRAAMSASIGRLTERHSSTGYQLTMTDAGNALARQQELLDETHRRHVAAIEEAKLQRTPMDKVMVAAATAICSFTCHGKTNRGFEAYSDRSPKTVGALFEVIYGKGQAAIADGNLVWRRDDGTSTTIGKATQEKFVLSDDAREIRNRVVGEALWRGARCASPRPPRINYNWESWHEYWGYPSVDGDKFEALVGFSAPPAGERNFPVYIYNNALYELGDYRGLRPMLAFHDEPRPPFEVRWTTGGENGTPVFEHFLAFVGYENKYKPDVEALRARMSHRDADTVSVVYQMRRKV